MPRTVLIVDDHAEFRRSARTLLEADGFCVVGEAGNAADALARVLDLHPDILLLDIQLPDHDGFWVAEQLHARPGGPAVVLISSRAAAAFGDRLTDARVCGFLPKASLSGPALAALVA